MDSGTKENREDRKALHKIKIHTPDQGYETFPVSIINRSTHEALTFDPSLGKVATISYSLTKAGSIRLRIVRREDSSLVLLTLQDWTEQEFGRHEVKWDGRDSSGNIIDNKKVLILFDAKDQASGGRHQDHDPHLCYDPKLIIKTTPDSTQTFIPQGDTNNNENNPPTPPFSKGGQGGFSERKIKGDLEIITSFFESHKLKRDSGCEVKYFIDYRLFKKEVFQNIIDKFYLRLDTTKLSNGEHFITVNVNDLNDHIGTASLKIKVNN